jgi:hypothetical protein
MTHRVGLWIDHKQAVVVILGEKGESIKKVESGAKHIEYRGAPRPKSAYSAQYSQGDDQLDNQFQVHINKYYEQVAGLLRGAQGILIFGPGEAKSELKARLKREKSLTAEVVIEPADRMTDRQIAARVRKHFGQPVKPP